MCRKGYADRAQIAGIELKHNSFASESRGNCAGFNENLLVKEPLRDRTDGRKLVAGDPCKLCSADLSEMMNDIHNQKALMILIAGDHENPPFCFSIAHKNGKLKRKKAIYLINRKKLHCFLSVYSPMGKIKTTETRRFANTPMNQWFFPVAEAGYVLLPIRDIKSETNFFSVFSGSIDGIHHPHQLRALMRIRNTPGLSVATIHKMLYFCLEMVEAVVYDRLCFDKVV